MTFDDIRKKQKNMTAANKSTVDDLKPKTSIEQVGEDAIEITTSNSMFEEKHTVILNSNEESKKSGSGAGDEEEKSTSTFDDEIKAIVDEDATEYPVDLTAVFDLDIKDNKKLKIVRKYVKKYRKDYTKNKVKNISAASISMCSDKDLLSACKNEVEGINRKLREINDGTGIYDMEVEAKRLVATNINFLMLITSNKAVRV